MKGISWAAAVIIGIAVIIAIVTGVTGAGKWPGFRYHDDMLSKGADVATALFVIALFLERSMAVVNGIIFKDEQEQIDTHLAAAAVAADAAATAAAATARVPALVAQNQKTALVQQQEADQLTRKLEARKDRVRLAVGFLVAVLVAAAGARTLSGLLANEAPVGDQGQLFVIMDILITAGLLAGGSQGLALLINVLKEQAKKSIETSRAELRRLRLHG